MKAYDGFVIFEKKLFFVLGVAHGDPIFTKIGPKNGNFWGFWQRFFRTTGFQLKLLISIESHNISLETSKINRSWQCVVLGQNLGQVRPNVVKKVKKQALSIIFFHVTWAIPIKAKSSGCTNMCVEIQGKL